MTARPPAWVTPQALYDRIVQRTHQRYDEEVVQRARALLARAPRGTPGQRRAAWDLMAQVMGRCGRTPAEIAAALGVRPRITCGPRCRLGPTEAQSVHCGRSCDLPF